MAQDRGRTSLLNPIATAVLARRELKTCLLQRMFRLPYKRILRAKIGADSELA